MEGSSLSLRGDVEQGTHWECGRLALLSASPPAGRLKQQKRICSQLHMARICGCQHARGAGSSEGLEGRLCPGPSPWLADGGRPADFSHVSLCTWAAWAAFVSPCPPSMQTAAYESHWARSHPDDLALVLGRPCLQVHSGWEVLAARTVRMDLGRTRSSP